MESGSNGNDRKREFEKRKMVLDARFFIGHILTQSQYRSELDELYRGFSEYAPRKPNYREVIA